ncbi:MAG: hypothetical protein ACYCOX_05900 [Acidobacteriaceae bacterium]
MEEVFAPVYSAEPEDEAAKEPLDAVEIQEDGEGKELAEGPMRAQSAHASASPLGDWPADERHEGNTKK